eukprot:5333620-Prymnesium_polylepis.1
MSFRDVVWPRIDLPLRGPPAYTNFFHLVHIIWTTHQLLADCLAYAWAVQEDAMASSTPVEPKAMPARLYATSAAAAALLQ